MVALGLITVASKIRQTRRVKGIDLCMDAAGFNVRTRKKFSPRFCRAIGKLTNLALVDKY